MFEGMIRSTFQHAIGVELPAFPVMTYADAMRRYGSDKPDLRVKLELTELTDVMSERRLQGLLRRRRKAKDGRVVALRVPGGGEMSRGEIDGYTEFVKIYGAKGLAWIKVNDVAQGPRRPAVADRQEPARRRRSPRSLKRTGASDGDLLFFGADKAKVVNDAIGALRVKIGHSEFGKSRGLVAGRVGAAVGGRLPDVRVRRGGAALERDAPPVHERRRTATRTGSRPIPGRCIAKAYDVVLNGIELGGGSVRIHREEVQSKVFRALKIDAEEAQREVRLPARRAAVRRAAARRHRDRPRPLRDADDRRRIAARRDRLPEDAARAGPAHQRARARSTRSSCASCTSACATSRPSAEPWPRQRLRRADAESKGAPSRPFRSKCSRRRKIPESVLVVIHTRRARRAAARARRRAGLLAERHRLEGHASTSRCVETCDPRGRRGNRHRRSARPTCRATACATGSSPTSTRSTRVWRHRYAARRDPQHRARVRPERAARRAVRLEPREHLRHRWLPLARCGRRAASRRRTPRRSCSCRAPLS